jgi:GTP-binding protein Era
VSALRKDGIVRVLDEAARLLPEGSARHPEDALTDRPLRFFAAEYVREPILEATKQEIPHSVAVLIEQFIEPPDGGTIHVAATIVTERQGQKRILVGKGGEMLRRIGIKARKRIEALTERQVMLKLWVRVVPNWRDRPQHLHELGYGSAGGGEKAGARAPGRPTGKKAKLGKGRRP